jgi:hypothetical protein
VPARMCTQCTVCTSLLSFSLHYILSPCLIRSYKCGAILPFRRTSATRAANVAERKFYLSFFLSWTAASLGMCPLRSCCLQHANFWNRYYKSPTLPTVSPSCICNTPQCWNSDYTHARTHAHPHTSTGRPPSRYTNL